jgi:hypothetical protein
LASFGFKRGGGIIDLLVLLSIMGSFWNVPYGQASFRFASPGWNREPRMRQAAVALILLLICVKGPLAAPNVVPLQPEQAPMQGEPQAATKILDQSQESAKPSGETPAGQAQDQRASESPSAAPAAPLQKPPAAAPEPRAAQPSAKNPGNVAASDRQQPAENHRYSFHRIKDDLFRLDTLTGEVAQCGSRAIGWSCKAVPDERAALESEIARLQRQNAELKGSLLMHGIELPGSVKPNVPSAEDDTPIANAPQEKSGPKPPKAADLDRAIAFIKDAWHRLLEMMAELQRDIQRKS